MLAEIYLGALAMALILVSSRSNSLSPDASSPGISPGSSVSNTSGSSSKRYRKRTCFAFNHMPNEDLNTKYYHLTTKVLEWRCRYCNQRYNLNSGTKVLMDYLRKEHDVTDQSHKEILKGKRQLLIEESIANREQHPRLRRRLNTGEYSTIKGDPLEILLVRLLTAGKPLSILIS
jgi:hypothetical protein